MTTATALFNYNDHKIRVVDIDHQPWFVAADVCRALECSLAKGTGAYLLGLSADERRPVPLGLIKGKGGNQLTIISESGLYKLIMRPDKPEARAFQDWVTRIVLPAIRKDGGYIVGEEKVATGEMDEDRPTCFPLPEISTSIPACLPDHEIIPDPVPAASTHEKRLQRDNGAGLPILPGKCPAVQPTDVFAAWTLRAQPIPFRKVCKAGRMLAFRNVDTEANGLRV